MKQFKSILPVFCILLALGCSSPKPSTSNNENPTNTETTKEIPSTETTTEVINQEASKEVKPLINCNFNPKIKSIQVNRPGFDQSFPIINIQGEQLTLSFDQFGEEVNNFTIKFIHCNYDWTPSPLEEMEYIEGFTDGNIINVESSHNTLDPYYHYRYTFPNEDFHFLMSGNYVALVMDEEENVMFARRFHVFMPRASIAGQTVKPNDPKYQYNDQALSFNVDLGDLTESNVLQNLKVVALQNYRWDQSLWEFQPTLIKDNLAEFKRSNGNHFPGLKEHRYVDIRSMYHLDGKVYSFKNDRLENKVVLFDDDVRSFKTYMFTEDINGRYTIVTRDNVDDQLEAEYVDVYFTLNYNNEMFKEEGLYILGYFNNYQPSEEYKMQFDPESKRYYLKLKMKQGYYEYLYGLYNYETKEIDYGFIEGHSPETENDYVILVYLHNEFDDYDQLIGVKILNTTNNN